jgi:nucleoside-diphosphate kinase
VNADYADLKGKSFFPGLIKYMAAGPVVAMVWQGLDAVKTGRAMLGATNPLQSPIGKLSVTASLPQLSRRFY